MSKGKIIGGVVIAFVALAAVGAAAAPQSQPANNAATPTPGVSTGVAALAAPPSVALPRDVFGSPVTAGDWTITVNSLTPSTSDNQFITPDAGNVFWVLDVTVVNNGTVAASAGSGLTVQDNEAFTHDAEILPIKEPDLGGMVAAGAKTRGYLTFQMAKAAKPASVIFQPNLFDSSVIVTITPS